MELLSDDQRQLLALQSKAWAKICIQFATRDYDLRQQLPHGHFQAAEAEKAFASCIPCSQIVRSCLAEEEFESARVDAERREAITSFSVTLCRFVETTPASTLNLLTSCQAAARKAISDAAAQAGKRAASESNHCMKASDSSGSGACSARARGGQHGGSVINM